MSGFLHVLFSPRAEGCPRLALGLLVEEMRQLGRAGSVAFIVGDPSDLLGDFGRLTSGMEIFGWKRWRYDLLFRSAIRYLRQVRPLGVICYTVGMHVPLAMAARALSIPFVLHVGNSPPTRDPVALAKIRLQMRVGNAFVNGYAACSDHIASLITAQYAIPASRVAAIPNGIELGLFLALRKERDGLCTGRPLEIGMVGTLEGHKDQAILLEAVARLVKAGSNVRLRLVGAGSREQELREHALRLGIVGSVVWRGSVLDVRPELQAMDVFAFAVTESEGLGIALVEALAAGLPVVASDVRACQEVLERGRWGALISGRDPDKWAAALSDTSGLRIPDIASLQRYDIGQTFRSYVTLLSDGATRN